MDAKFLLGRIWGLPVFVTVWFIIVMVMFEADYLTSGNSVYISIGFLMAVGIGFSVLVHELAHAVTGHSQGLRPSHIELNGLGGLCYFAGSVRPMKVWQNVAILLAGPLSNLALYYVFSALQGLPAISQNIYVGRVVAGLAWINFWMFAFNLLPAYPLDGGRALEALLSKVISLNTCRLIIGVLGLCVAAYCAYLGINGNSWMLVLALTLGMANYEALQSAKNPPWQRWN